MIDIIITSPFIFNLIKQYIPDFTFYIICTKNFMVKIKIKKKYIMDTIVNFIKKNYYGFHSFLDNRAKAKQEKRDKKREKFRRNMDRFYDEMLDKKMVKKGFHSCHHCKFYSSPQILLNEISDAVVSKMEKLERYNKHDLILVKELILNDDPHNKKDASELKKYACEFEMLELNCKHCNKLFDVKKLAYPDDKIKIEFIKELQAKRDKMCYLNLEALKYETRVIL